MRIRPILMVSVFALMILAGSGWAQQSSSLEQVLAGMDAASAGFRDMDSDILRETVTVFINHTRTETGRMQFVRDPESRIRVTLTEPARKEFLINEGMVRIYNPSTNVVEQIGLGEHEDKVEFMVIGFGTSREDLLRFYDVSLADAEMIDGVDVAVLDLIPRDPDVARHFNSIRLWMDPERWIPVQTRATQPSGDYLTVRFSNVKINGGVPDAAFRLDLPDDVQILEP